MGLNQTETQSGPFHVDGATGSDRLQNSFAKRIQILSGPIQILFKHLDPFPMKNLWVNEIARCDYLPKYRNAFVSEPLL